MLSHIHLLLLIFIARASRVRRGRREEIGINKNLEEEESKKGNMKNKRWGETKEEKGGEYGEEKEGQK